MLALNKRFTLQFVTRWMQILESKLLRQHITGSTTTTGKRLSEKNSLRCWHRQPQPEQAPDRGAELPVPVDP
ncbi:MAG: hypothetical protein C4317_00755 [Acidimicrobiia bacterium]